MKISFQCLYCGAKNYTTDNEIDEYIQCEKCKGLHDIKINEDGEIIIEEF